MATFGAGINVSSSGSVARSVSAGTTSVTVPANTYYVIAATKTNAYGTVTINGAPANPGAVCGPGLQLQANCFGGGGDSALIVYTIFTNA